MVPVVLRICVETPQPSRPWKPVFVQRGTDDETTIERAHRARGQELDSRVL